MGSFLLNGNEHLSAVNIPSLDFVENGAASRTPALCAALHYGGAAMRSLIQIDAKQITSYYFRN